jgi:hypothetical protein
LDAFPGYLCRSLDGPVFDGPVLRAVCQRLLLNGLDRAGSWSSMLHYPMGYAIAGFGCLGFCACPIVVIPGVNVTLHFSFCSSRCIQMLIHLHQFPPGALSYGSYSGMEGWETSSPIPAVDDSGAQAALGTAFSTWAWADFPLGRLCFRSMQSLCSRSLGFAKAQVIGFGVALHESHKAIPVILAAHDIDCFNA